MTDSKYLIINCIDNHYSYHDEIIISNHGEVEAILCSYCHWILQRLCGEDFWTVRQTFGKRN